MVDQIASSTSVQAASASQQDRNLSQRHTTAEIYLKALNDAVTLSSQAVQIVNQLSQRTTIAEAWLQQLSEPPDLTASNPTPVAVAASGGDSAAPQADPQVVMRTSLSRAKGDLSWLLDTMSPPKVDTAAVVQALAARMTADSVGIRPPVDQVVAQAEQADTVPVMYVENLNIIGGKGGTSVTVDRVTLTAVDPTLVPNGGAGDPPLVLDLGGQAKNIPESQMLPAERKLREAGEPRSLAVIRQGGAALPEGNLHVKMDLLIPIR